MAPVLSCIHRWALVALAWDPLPVHSVSNQQLIPSPPGSLPGSPVSSLALALFYLLYGLTSPENIMFLVPHKFIDDNPSLDSIFCLHEGREYLGFILFPSMFAKLFLFVWFALFLMNECILEKTVWELRLGSGLASAVRLLWPEIKPISPSEPLFLHLDLNIFRVSSL